MFIQQGRILALLAWLAAAVPSAAAQRPCDPSTPLGPSRDLYCIELVPAPGIDGASGLVELGHVPGPFTVAVTADGPRILTPWHLQEDRAAA